METLCQDGALPNAFYLKNFSPTTSANSLRGATFSAWRGLQLARVDKVLEGSRSDFDNPCNGRFGDMLAEEQLDFLLLPIEFGLP